VTFHTFIALEGALILTALACLVLCIAWYVLHHVYWWRRLERACGSEWSAQATVYLIEADRNSRAELTTSTGDN
jgi:hypothetical protein